MFGTNGKVHVRQEIEVIQPQYVGFERKSWDESELSLWKEGTKVYGWFWVMKVNLTIKRGTCVIGKELSW